MSNNSNFPLGISSDIFRTTKIELANSYINSHVAPHQLNLLGRGSAVNFRCQRWHVGTFQVCDFSYGDCEVEIRLNRSDERGFFVVVPLNGRAQVHLKDREYSLRPGSVMAFNTRDAERTSFRDSTHFRNLNICMSYDEVKQFLAHELGAPIRREFMFCREPVAVGPGFRQLLDYIRWLSSTIDYRVEPMLLSSPHLAAHLHSLLMSLLVSTLKNNYQDSYVAPRAKYAAPNYVRRAEEFIRSHAREPITACQVAHEVGIAVRTLHLGFQRHRNHSAMEFLRDLRLALARQELSTAKDRNLSVGSIAQNCGFSHLGRFAKAYQLRYGERPSETLLMSI